MSDKPSIPHQHGRSQRGPCPPPGPPPRAAAHHKGQATPPPAKVPASGKQRRRMVKAAAYRLALLVRAPVGKVLRGGVDLAACTVRRGRVGDARRLLRKLDRLKRPP